MRMSTVLALTSCLSLTAACGQPQAGSRTAALGAAARNGEAGTGAANAAITRYPIVLLHGFLGFDKILFIDYFYHVKSELRQQGFTVEAAQVSPVNTVQFRAKQLAKQIDAILAATGASKVNLIAHSMGGLDARELISTMGYGDRVASLSTVGTPHLGSPLAEFLYPLLGRGEGSASAASSDGNEPYGALMQLLGMDPQGAVVNTFDPTMIDLPGALWNLSETFARDYFAPTHPDDPRVFYQSWGGACDQANISHPDWLTGAFVVLTNFMHIHAGDNDGLVPVSSAAHGLYRGTFNGDHVDEVGQLFGNETYGRDYMQFYVDMAHDLAARGF